MIKINNIILDIKCLHCVWQLNYNESKTKYIYYDSVDSQFENFLVEHNQSESALCFYVLYFFVFIRQIQIYLLHEYSFYARFIAYACVNLTFDVHIFGNNQYFVRQITTVV